MSSIPKKITHIMIEDDYVNNIIAWGSDKRDVCLNAETFFQSNANHYSGDDGSQILKRASCRIVHLGQPEFFSLIRNDCNFIVVGQNVYRPCPIQHEKITDILWGE